VRFPAPLLRHSGVAAVVVLWLTVVVGMLRTGLELLGDQPISYLGTDGTTDTLFRVGLLVAAAAFVAFAWAVRRRLLRETGFLGIFVVGMAGQAVVAVVPLTDRGTSHDVHVTAGILLGLSLPLFIWRFAAALAPGPARRRAYALLWVEVAACTAGVLLSRAGLAFVAEVVPAVGFHLWVVLVTVGWSTWAPAPSPVGTAA
jgi:hypothetical protein